jgi:hypothetical protein
MTSCPFTFQLQVFPAEGVTVPTPAFTKLFTYHPQKCYIKTRKVIPPFPYSDRICLRVRLFFIHRFFHTEKEQNVKRPNDKTQKNHTQNSKIQSSIKYKAVLQNSNTQK